MKGLGSTNSSLAQSFRAIEGGLKQEILKTGKAVVRDANINAAGIGFFTPSGSFVQLAGKVHGNEIMEGQGYVIWVDADKLGAYVEFGTGEYAKTLLAGYSKPWQDLAYDFFVNGEGRLPARPYLYPAWVENTTGMVARMRDRLRKLSK